MTTLTYFVVIDPTEERQPALQQAHQMAVKTGATVHLFCCDYIDDLSEFGSRRAAKQAVLKQTRERLAALAKPLHDNNVLVSSEAYWNQDWHHAILQASSRQGADLIFKTTKPHGRLKRAFSETSDILLLRQACCPVLLTKTGTAWHNNTILAALALEANNPAHDVLNSKIIAEAHRLVKHTGATLHLVSAIDDQEDMAEVLQVTVDDDAPAAETLVSERFGVPVETIYLQTGKPKDVIATKVNDLKPDLLILGTVARRGLPGLVLGNTAEQVLDNLDVDILAIN